MSQAGVVVTASIATGSGTLGGTLTATTNSSGVATFTNLRITGSGAHTLHFVAAGLLAVNCGTITVSCCRRQRSCRSPRSRRRRSRAASALAQQPSIQLRDASNNAVGQSGVTVTVAIATGGGTLGGTTTASTNASGVATFSNLSISGATGNRTLSFTSGALTAATSSAVAVTAPATPTQVGLTVQAISGQSGVTLAPGFVVQLMDATGAAVAQSGVVITATQATGSATLGGTLTASTGATGAANFSNLNFTGSGTQTVKFTSSTGLTVTSGSISITAAGGFATPNILNNASFETGWNGFTDWTGAASSHRGVTRDNTIAAPDGSWSIKRSWIPNPTQDGGSQVLYHFGQTTSGGGYDRVSLRFSFKLTSSITTIMKFARFYSADMGVNLGGLFIQNAIQRHRVGLGPGGRVDRDEDRAVGGPGDRR